MTNSSEKRCCVDVESVVSLTKEAAGRFPYLTDFMPVTGKIRSINQKGVATVEVTKTQQIHLKFLTDPESRDAYDFDSD